MKEDMKVHISEKLSPKQKKLVQILEKRGAKLPCPRCGHRDFIVGDEYFSNPVTPDLRSFKGISIPTAILVCSNCGYVSQHALGVLNLLPKEEEKEVK